MGKHIEEEIDWTQVSVAKPLGTSTGLFTPDSPLMQYAVEGMIRGTLGCARVRGGVRFSLNVTSDAESDTSLSFPDELNDADYERVAAPLLERGWLEVVSPTDGYTRELRYAVPESKVMGGSIQEMGFIYSHLGVIGFVIGAWAEEAWGKFL
jgi:hypothetical protein